MGMMTSSPSLRNRFRHYAADFIMNNSFAIVHNGKTLKEIANCNNVSWETTCKTMAIPGQLMNTDVAIIGMVHSLGICIDVYELQQLVEDNKFHHPQSFLPQYGPSNIPVKTTCHIYRTSCQVFELKKSTIYLDTSCDDDDLIVEKLPSKPLKKRQLINDDMDDEERALHNIQVTATAKRATGISEKTFFKNHQI